MHSRITFYVYAKIGQANGGAAALPAPLDPPLVVLYIILLAACHLLAKMFMHN